MSFGEPPKPVLCEWIRYTAHTMDQAPDRFQKRVQAIVDRFSAAPLLSEFKVLQCEGFFHSPHRTSYGLLFNYPGPTDKNVAPVNLKRMMREIERPSLGELFVLAQIITKIVLYLHQVGWLHKSVVLTT